MQDKPCSWGTEPVRGWQIPVAEGGDSVLTLSLPELHDGTGWPQPGHVGTGLQDGPPSTQTTDSVQNPRPSLVFFLVCNTRNTNLPFLPFPIHRACSRAPDLHICLQDPNGRDLHLG